MGKKQSFQQIVLRELDIYMQKDEVALLPHTICKNELKMDQRPK